MRVSVLILVLTGLVFTGCTGSRKYYKAAEKLEKQGLTHEAAEFYLESLRRKPTNSDAQIKLKQTGQKYVSALSSDFFRYYSMEQDDRALSTFEKMKEFTENAAQLNVRLEYPHAYDEDYKELIERYCRKHYQEGEEKFNQKWYAEAIRHFDAIKKYKSEYRKMNYYYKEAYCEPIYERAMTLMDEKKYDQAKQELNKIIGKYPDYRNIQRAYELAQTGQIRYWAMVDVTLSGEKNFSTGAVQEIRNSLKNSGKIQMVSNALFENMRLHHWNNELLRPLTLASGADYLYVVSFSGYHVSSDGPSRTKSRAWLQQTMRINDSIFYTYTPVTYFQVRASKKVSVTFHQKLVRSSDMNVLYENARTMEVSDRLEYHETEKALHARQIQNLFPVNPAVTPVQMYAVRSWRQLFEARKSFRPDPEMNQQLKKQISSESSQVLSYLK